MSDQAYLALLRSVLTDLHRVTADDPGKAHIAHEPTLEGRRHLREIGADWPVHAETMIGARRLAQVQEAIETVLAENVPGDFLEAGVWRGGACILARAVLRAHGVTDRMVWVADSFAGLPPPDPERYPADAGDAHSTEAFLRVSRDEVAANFAKYGLLDDQVRFLEGWFEDTLPTAPVARLAVLRLDGDMYGSTIVALESLYDRVAPGGYVIIDDYGAVPGCRQAVDDFRLARAIAAPLVEIDWTGRYWRVPKPPRVVLPPPRRDWVDSAELANWTRYASPAAETLGRQAEAALASGDTERAVKLARAALEFDANAMPAHVVLAAVRCPGPDYLAWLRTIHERMRPAVYLEIGVFAGDSLALVDPGCLAIGVDPAPPETVPEGAILVASTSDAFFAGGEAERLLGARGFDLAFIDGCHRFEYVLRDFIHAEAYAAPGAAIVLHDTCPLDEATSTADRQTTFYSGDAWKLLPVLQELRPDLRVRTIKAAPTGLTIVDRLSPDSRVLSERYDEIVTRFQDLPYREPFAEPAIVATLLGRAPCVPAVLAREELAAMVENFETRCAERGIAVDPRFYWYHTVDLGDGLVTPGTYDYREDIGAFGLPDDMRAATALDIGSATGYFAFELERRGARVFSVETPSLTDWDHFPGESNTGIAIKMRDLIPLHSSRHAQEVRAMFRELDFATLHHVLLDGPFRFCAARLGSRVQRIATTVYALPDVIPHWHPFDWVLATDVLLHTIDPLRALAAAARVCAGTLVIGQTMEGGADDPPGLRYVGGLEPERDDAQWWEANLAWFLRVLPRLGFREVEVVGRFTTSLRPYGHLVEKTVIHARR